MPSEAPLLAVELSVDYPNKPRALHTVSFYLQPGESLGLVGESGSGKSTIALALLGLLDWKGGRVSGRVAFDGRNLLSVGEKEMRRVRGRQIGLVLQSPMSSLNPALRIGRQLAEVWRAHGHGDRNARIQAVCAALARVGLPYDEEFQRRYPRQISVGQAQRVLIAMATMHSPPLLIADEPTSALDAITQVEILDMLARLNREMGTALLYISHDLQSVAALCQRVAILQSGTIIEQGRTETVLCRPRHAYTQQLLACAPWLPWWLELSRERRPQQNPSSKLSAPLPTALVREYWGLKSPYQEPMGS